MPATHAPQPVLDLQELLSRVDNDREILGELLAIFRQELPHHLLLLQDAANSGDAARVQIAGHSLKGMLSNISAPPAAAAAARIEQLGREKQMNRLSAALADLQNEIARLMPALQACLDGK